MDSLEDTQCEAYRLSLSLKKANKARHSEDRELQVAKDITNTKPRITAGRCTAESICFASILKRLLLLIVVTMKLL